MLWTLWRYRRYGVLGVMDVIGVIDVIGLIDVMALLVL